MWALALLGVGSCIYFSWQEGTEKARTDLICKVECSKLKAQKQLPADCLLSAFQRGNNCYCAYVKSTPFPKETK